MMIRIPQLPLWCLTNINPALYDSESLTVVEQTAKIYAKMQALIDDYNSFASEVNITIEKLVTDVNADQEELECQLTKLIHDYIITIDAKIAHQDRVIAESIEYIKANIGESVTQVINDMKESGELTEELTRAFEELGTRVSTLETANQEMTTRITNLEKSYYSLEYDSENEEFTLVKGGIE